MVEMRPTFFDGFNFDPQGVAPENCNVLVRGGGKALAVRALSMSCVREKTSLVWRLTATF